MSICDQNTLTNLYDWLETIPFSRSKKNFARDFSDGILAAELIKYFFPTFVDMHNYPASSSFEQKKVNWSVLNQKVLRKLDFPLSDITISDLASGSKREATEYFLYTLREKIDIYMKKIIGKLKKKRDYSQNVCTESVDDVLKETLDISKNLIDTTGSGSLVKKSSEIAKRKTYIVDSNLDNVPFELYDEKVQELLACEETIQILKARIQRLENMLKLQNVTINRQQQALEKLKVTQNIITEKMQENKLLQKKFK